MKPRISEHRTLDGRTPTRVELLRSPIDFIAEDHLRLRIMCAEMDRLADAAQPEPDTLADLLDYLTHELPDLLADEDMDLMPLVLQRAKPEDELPRLVGRLAQEHAEIGAHLGEIVDEMAGVSEGAMVPDQLRDTLRRLAHEIRRHLILENAVLLPLARVRLKKRDMAALQQAMLRRRGLDDPFEA